MLCREKSKRVVSHTCRRMPPSRSLYPSQKWQTCGESVAVHHVCVCMLGPTERGFNHLNSQGPDSGTEMSHCHQSTSMASVEIYLVTGEVQVSFLRIPIKDVKRLSVRPFKWLRFVMYAICGTPGKISATPDGDEVEYDRTELANVDIQYYYQGKVLFLYVDFCLPQSQLLKKIVASWTFRV